MAKAIIPYRRAVELNLPRYYTGKPCFRCGQRAERITATSECLACKPEMDALKAKEEKVGRKGGPKTDLEKMNREFKALIKKHLEGKLTVKEINRLNYIKKRDKALAREAAKRARAKEARHRSVNPQTTESRGLLPSQTESLASRATWKGKNALST